MNPRSQSKEQAQDTGRKGYREPHEPPDGIRPKIAYSEFWEDPEEQATYEHAVQANPILPDEGHGTYIQRIASIVAGRYAKVGTMPRPRMSEKEYQKRKRLLDGQKVQEWKASEHR